MPFGREDSEDMAAALFLFLKCAMCCVLFSYARLIIDVENEINVRTMIYLNYFKRSGETLFIYFSREVWSINAGTTPCLEIQKPAANVAILIAVHKS